MTVYCANLSHGMFKFRIYPWNSKTTLQLCSHSTGYLFVEPYKALRYGMDSNGPRRHKSFTQIEHRAGAVGRKDLVPLIPVLSPEYLLPSQWVPVLAPTYEADLATERERHLTTGKRAERTKLDFRCPICCSAIGEVSCLICARRLQLTFLFCY